MPQTELFNYLLSVSEKNPSRPVVSEHLLASRGQCGHREALSSVPGHGC